MYNLVYKELNNNLYMINELVTHRKLHNHINIV